MNFLLRATLKKIDAIFYATVAVPTLLACLYFGLVASDVYISESRFVVRSPDKPATSGLGIILKTAGFTNAGDEVFAAEEYIKSRDALAAVNSGKNVVEAFTRSNISLADRFNAIGLSGSFEDLYKYFSKKVSVKHDTTTSITTLTVRAYSARDAYLINRQLLEQSEGLVNRLNARGRKDLIEYAQAEVAEAQQDATRAAIALAEFRNRRGVIDPERQATVQLQMISKLQDELIGAKMLLYQLKAVVPQNPQIETLQVRIAGLTKEIEQQLSSVAGDRSSLSAAAAQYQRVLLERELADRRLTAAMTSLQEARNEARRKQAYIERIVQPNLPDEALEPRRVRAILATFAMGLVSWGVLSMLLAGVREHRQ